MDANGDYNSDPDEDLRKFISEANLVDYYYEKFRDLPRTFIRGSKRLDYHLFDPGVVSSILRIGYLGTHVGADTDHVYGYCDLDSKKLFQGVINRPITLHSRDFLLAHFMEPMEHAIRNQLLPSFLGIDTADVNIKFRELLALAAKRGGLGIRNPMATAEDYFNTSMDACSYLVGTLVKREPFD